MSAQEAAPHKPAAAPSDPVYDLAMQLFIEMCSRVYTSTAAEKPQPKAIAQMSFKLAEAFVAANFEFNPAAIAAREARSKAAVTLADVNIDFASITKPK
jgi:hypothetical protein